MTMYRSLTTLLLASLLTLVGASCKDDSTSMDEDSSMSAQTEVAPPTAGATACTQAGCNQPPMEPREAVLVSREELCEPLPPGGPAIAVPPDPGCEDAACGTTCKCTRECEGSDVAACNQAKKCRPILK